MRQYLANTRDPYKSLLASVNLAAALLHVQRHREALVLIEAGMKDARNNGFTRLLANLHELRAQLSLAESQLVVKVLVTSQ